MAHPKSFLTLSIVFACFSLIALFAGLALPSIEHNNLQNQIQADNILTRETARSWGEIPGIRNITYQKVFTLYNMDGARGDILAGQVDMKATQTFVYNYTYTYKDLQFAPASNSSVQYHKMYSHTYQGPDENVLKTTTVSTLNIGALKGITQQADMSRAQVFVQTLFKIYTTVQNIVSLLVTDYVFDLYIHNQTLTNRTIFMYNDTVPAELSDQLWSDPTYGWSSPKTLAPWVNLVQGYVGTFGTYDPTTNSNYGVIKAHFGLTTEQMSNLIGATAQGFVGNSSMLYLVTLAVSSTLAGNFGCSSPMACTQNELFARQFFEASITKNPIFKGIPARNSVSEMNETFPVPPEILSVFKGQDVPFSDDLANAIFSLNADGTGPATDSTNLQRSLFSLTNVEFIIQNQNNSQAVFTYFNLDNVQQAQVLIDYVNYIVDEFVYRGQGDELRPYKYMADVTANSMNRLQGDLANLLLVNVTAIGTHNGTIQAGLTCASILKDTIGASQDLIDSICNNPDVSLDQPQGQAPWVSAYYNGPGSSIYAYLESTTGIKDEDLQKLLDPSQSQFGKIILDVVNAIAVALDCGSARPCNAQYVSRLQWTTSNFTKQLPTPYFGKLYDSVADIFPNYFGLYFIPEFTVYQERKHFLPFYLTADQGEILFSFNNGSINNNFELLTLFVLANNKNYTAIQDRFNLSSPAVLVLQSYFDDAFLDYYMGGLTQSISIYDLLWGYQDPFLTKLSTSPFFDYMQVFYPPVSILGDKDNLKTYANDSYNMINSGADTVEDVRLISQYKGNSTLNIITSYFDGNNYTARNANPWGGAGQKINGTDGAGFQSLLDKTEPITIFEDRFLRNLNLKFDSEFKYGPNSYDFYLYKPDPAQFAVSDIFYNDWEGYINITSLNDTPIVVSPPYFKGCDNSSYQQITFNSSSAASLQDSVDSGSFVVESVSGITANYTKTYQYNLINSIPNLLYFKNSLAAIPLLMVNETFVTPDAVYDGDLKDYYSKSHSISVFMIVSLSLAVVMILIAGIMLRYYLKKKNGSAVSHLQESPGHDYQSLQVDSVGGFASVGQN